MGREKDYIIVNKQHPPSGGYLSGFTSGYKKKAPLIGMPCNTGTQSSTLLSEFIRFRSFERI